MRLSYNGQEPLAAAEHWAVRLYRARDWRTAERIRPEWNSISVLGRLAKRVEIDRTIVTVAKEFLICENTTTAMTTAIRTAS